MPCRKTIFLWSSLGLGCFLFAATQAALCQISLDQRSIRFSDLASATPRSGFCAMQKAQTTNPLAKIGTKAYSNPISTSQIEFVASTTAAGTVTIRVQEGAMGKIIAVDARSGYAIIPVVNQINGDQVDFTIMNLAVDEKGNESVRYLGKATGKMQELTTLDAAVGLTIKLRNIAMPDNADSPRSATPTKPAPGILFAEADKVDCCVTCGNVEGLRKLRKL